MDAKTMAGFTGPGGGRVACCGGGMPPGTLGSSLWRVRRRQQRLKCRSMVVLAAREGAPRSLSVLLPMRTWIPQHQQQGAHEVPGRGNNRCCSSLQGNLVPVWPVLPWSPWPLAGPRLEVQGS